jgi:hypothetical protein
MSLAPYLPISKPQPRPKKPRKGLCRFVRISQRSKKALARMRAWTKAKREAFAETGGRCVVRSPACTTWATDGGHRLPRRRGGTDTKDNCDLTCRECHTYLHNHSKWAEAHGFMLSQFEGRNSK